MTFGELFCSSNGTSGETGGMEMKDKKTVIAHHWDNDWPHSEVLDYTNIQSHTAHCVCLPAVCVAVTVDVALAGAARSWTLQHIFMHGQNYTTNTTQQTVGGLRCIQVRSTEGHGRDFHSGFFSAVTLAQTSLFRNKTPSHDVVSKFVVI